MQDIQTYILLSREIRSAHVDILQPCYELGGNSTQFKAALAHKLGTSIPRGRIMLCHACNNGKCANLSHLYWGTDSENAYDRIAFEKQGRVATSSIGHLPHMDLGEYIQLAREERRAHLDLHSPCDCRGGNSWEFRGLLAFYLKTTISCRNALMCHACNNAGCSNPRHLYWGTNFENSVTDRKEAGTLVSVWDLTIAKHGFEKAMEMKKQRDMLPALRASVKKTTGVQKSPEHRAKIAASVKAQHESRIAAGLRSGAKGLARTPEQRERMSAGTKAYYAKQKELGLTPKSYKATLSPEHRQKIKEAHQKRAALLKEQKEKAALSEERKGTPDESSSRASAESKPRPEREKAARAPQSLSVSQPAQRLDKSESGAPGPGKGARGTPKSEEHRRKLSEAAKRQQERRKEMGLNQLTEEQKKKISEGKKAYYAQLKEQGEMPRNYRATKSPEHRAKIGEASRKRHALLRAQKEAALKDGLGSSAGDQLAPATD